MAVSLVADLGVDAVAVAVLGWTTLEAYRERGPPSGRPFVAVLATLTAWELLTLGETLPILRSIEALQSVWDLGQLGAALLIPGIWTIYVLGYTGRGTGLTRRRIIMLGGIALPVVITAVFIAIGASETVIEGVLALMASAELFYLVSLLVYATYLLFNFSRDHARVSTWQAVVLTGAIIAPYLVGNGTGGTGSEGPSLGLLLAGGLMAVALWRYPVLIGFPKADYVARTRVVEALQEAVLVLDLDDHVLDANEMAATLFDAPIPGIIGDPLESVVEELTERDLSAGATGIVTLQTTKGRRQFQFSVSAVDGTASESDSDAMPVARTVLLRDVTDQRIREQRLTVLNRVLRHNLRNKLDVALAHAELVEDPELKRGIQESANDLLALSQKARDAEEVMTATEESPATVDLTAVTENVVDEYREKYDGEVSLSAPAELPVTTHRRIVEELLSELVENALVHGGEDPAVEVEVGKDPGTAAVLTVADDGSGIPLREREILESGTETQLEHGQGIGLWFVTWAVTQLGGDISFSENEPTGSVMTVRLYETTTGS